MAEVDRCPQCGCDMPPDAPAGLCPECLLGVGLDASEPLAGQGVTQASPRSGFVPPKPHELADRFPQFEVLDLLGYGGMGAVYKARQKSLDRLVALKIIKPDAADNPGFAERFEREAKALAKLNHSHIVSVYDFGKSSHDTPRDGNFLYYFVMEYVDGMNLRRLIESKELLPEQAMQIIPQICDALQFAHDEGIVHRDIKPENILVDSKGRVKIADFGLAKLLGKTAIEQDSLTGTHQVMGTPRYMAPEQMEGSKTVDHRADIYSLGIVFYEMLTGELPMGSFEPPSRKVQVDVRLDEIVLRSMAREPKRRYQHASDVRTDVELVRADSRQPVAAYAALVSNETIAAVTSLPVPQDSSTKWSVVLWGLCIVVPVLGLIGFAMWYVQSAWVLLALALPWLGVGALQIYCDEMPNHKGHTKAANVVLLCTFLATLGLIGFAIVIEHSAWPLFGIVPVVVGGFAGCGIGYIIAKEEESESEGATDDDEDEGDEEEEEENPQEKMQTAAWWVGAVGAYRGWTLLSGSKWSEMLDSLGSAQFDVSREMLLGLSGPVILIASIAMYHARFYWFAVTACVLCLLSGSLPPLIIGIWSLIVLFDPQVRALFLANDLASGATGSASGFAPAGLKPQLQHGDGDARGSTLSGVWIDWWRERDALFTRKVQAILMLLHLGCLFAFLGFTSQATMNDEGQRMFTHEIGFPSPWFTIEATSVPGFSFNQAIHWTFSAWVIAACGGGLAYLYCRIEKVRNPVVGFWHKPEAFMLVWCVLALADIGFGVGVGHLTTNLNQSGRPTTQDAAGASGTDSRDQTGLNKVDTTNPVKSPALE